MDKRQLKLVALILIPLLAGVLFFYSNSARESERKLRVAKEQELSAKLLEIAESQAKIQALTQEKTDLESLHTSKISDLEAKISELEEAGRFMSERVATLSQEKETMVLDNLAKEKRIADLTKKIHKLELERIDLTNSLKKLDGQKPSSSSASSSIEAPRRSTSILSSVNALSEKPRVDPVSLGKIVVQKSSGYAARIQQVDPIYGFVVLNAGSSDGLRQGTVLNVIRDKRLIGRAVVEKTREKTAAAIILPEWTTEKVEVGDYVTKF